MATTRINAVLVPELAEIAAARGSFASLQERLQAISDQVAHAGWKPPVATTADLPGAGNTDGDVRVVLIEDAAYQWDAQSGTWKTVIGGGGGGGGGLFLYEEQCPEPGTTTVTLQTGSYTPGTDFAAVYYNGMLMRPGPDNDYQEDGQTLQFASAFQAGDRVTVLGFRRTSGGTGQLLKWYRHRVVPTPGAIDIAVGQAYTPGDGSLQVYRNGQLQILGADNDYLEQDSTTVRFHAAFAESETVDFILPYWA